MVAWTACLGIPTEDTELMVRAMQGLTADAPVLKTRAGISTRGRKLKNPYTPLALSWPEGATAPAKQDMLSAVAGALDSLGLDHRHYAVCAAHSDTNCPHVHVAVSRVDPETGRAVNLAKGATRRLSRWAEQYERNHGGIVVPTCRAARGAGGPPQPRARLPPGRHAARAGPLYRRAPAPAVGEAAPQTAVFTPPVRRPTSARGGRSCSNGSAATCGVSGPLKTSGSSAGDTNGEPAMPRGPRRTPPAAPPLFPPRSASVRKLRADGARTRIDLRRPPTGPNARRVRRLGHAVAREPTGSPRIPTADVIIDTFVSSVEAPSGARLSAPAP